MFERRGFGGRRFGGGFSGGFRERVDIPKPVKVGEEYDVEISEVGNRGDGIARIKNFVVFVNGVKQGEKAHIKIKEVRDRFAIGEKTEGGSAEAAEKAGEPEETESAEEVVSEPEAEVAEESTEEEVEAVEKE
jgi:predicted RNA-binding protein with TRAM domain